MTTRISTTTDLPLETQELTVTIREPVLVAVGEYAEEGQPDVLVHIVHAVDNEGRDVRKLVARVIADALRPIDTEGVAHT